MDFKTWYENFVSNKDNFSQLTTEKMLELAFVAGMKFMELQTPLYSIDENKAIVEIPREDELPKDKKFISDEELESFDFDAWLKENKNVSK